MKFGESANLGQLIRDRLIDVTQAIGGGAAGMIRNSARLARRSKQAAEEAEKAGQDAVSRVKLPDLHPPPAQGDHRRRDPNRELSKITDRDVEVIQSMTGRDSPYRRVNKGLREGNLSPSDRVFVDELKAAISKLRNYRGTVFRGAQLSPESLARYKKGSFVAESGFTSTSRRSDRAFGGNTRYKIQSKTGRNLGRYSPLPHEKEVLFLPGTRFEVTGVKYNKHWCRTEITMVER